MRNKLHFILLGMLLLSALTFLMVLSATSTLARNLPSTGTDRQVIQLSQRQTDPYEQGYRQGYQQGYHDGLLSCTPSGQTYKPRAISLEEQGYADGYNAGFQAACGSR